MYKEYTVKVFKNGDKYWYQNGKYHRDDGPACEYASGTKLWVWYKNGLRHRDDGPAIEYADGTKAWYIHGKEYTEAEFNKRQTPDCTGKVIEIEGRKYKLIPKEA